MEMGTAEKITFLKKVCWGVAAVDLKDRSCGRKLVTL